MENSLRKNISCYKSNPQMLSFPFCRKSSKLEERGLIEAGLAGQEPRGRPRGLRGGCSVNCADGALKARDAL